MDEPTKYIDGILYRLCACGFCGEYFIAHKLHGKDVRFINGHSARLNAGKKRTPEFKQYLSTISKGENNVFYGKSHTKETKLKISAANDGENNGMYGRQHSLESRKKMSEKRILQASPTGNKHWNWKGGISKEPYAQDWTKDLKDAIRKRDNFECQMCGASQDDFNESLLVHHIDYDKENCDPRNLISLCRPCHFKTNYNRDKWVVYFKPYQDNGMNVGVVDIN
jgi:hypothetical protein